MEVINPPGTLVCPRCGHHNDERAFFCSQCGTPIGSRSGYRPEYEHRRPYYEVERQGYYYDGLPLISLLVTIFGFFVAGFIGPLVGVILAHISLNRINRRGENTNRGLAVAALVIGYFLLITGLLLLISLGIFVGSALFNHGWMGAGHWRMM